MIKKKLFFITLLFLMIVITGCGKNEENITEKNTIDKKNSLLDDSFNKYELNCSELKNIKDVVNSTYGIDGDLSFINNNGKLYTLSLSDIYSNDKSCIELDVQELTRYDGSIPTTFTKFFNSYAVGVDNNLYSDNYLYPEGLDRFKPDFDYNNVQLPSDIKINNFFYYKGSGTYQEEDKYRPPAKYYWIKEGKIYPSLFDEYDFMGFSTENDSLDLNEDETILYVIDGTIKTNKRYLTYKYEEVITNKEECEKYADIKCEEKIIEGMFENEQITKIYNDIIFYKQLVDGSEIVIDNNGILYYKIV